MEEIFVSHWKSLEELKTYLPMSSTLFSPNFSVHLRSYTKCQCYPESWARYIHTQFEENQVSTSTTTQQNVFTFQQIQPQAIFAEAHIDKFEGCTFNIIVLIFCGDQSKISRPNENWLLSDRGTNRHYLHCSCTFGHFSYIVVSTTSFFIEPVWKILSSFIDEVCAKAGLWTVMCRSNRNFNISPPPDGHLTPLPSREERIWLSESSRGWGIWTAPSISCEIPGVASCRGGRGVRGFSWKRLCLWGQLVTSFVPYLKVFKFWYF